MVRARPVRRGRGRGSWGRRAPDPHGWTIAQERREPLARGVALAPRRRRGRGDVVLEQEPLGAVGERGGVLRDAVVGAAPRREVQDARLARRPARRRGGRAARRRRRRAARRRKNSDLANACASGRRSSPGPCSARWRLASRYGSSCSSAEAGRRRARRARRAAPRASAAAAEHRAEHVHDRRRGGSRAGGDEQARGELVGRVGRPRLPGVERPRRRPRRGHARCSVVAAGAGTVRSVSA